MAKHPVPKKKTSKASRDARRSHHYLTPPNLVPCPTCKGLKPAHVVCPHCGSYGGKQVLKIED
ncbi:MAG: 50S ribosomal protein L32 [Truepera sp.]|nr:50S ribosomal protein L32 [Truepera sp.]